MGLPGGSGPAVTRRMTVGRVGDQMQEAKSSASRGALFEPTGHADLDRLRKDGVSAWSPWYMSAAAGAAAGLTLVVAIPLIYLVFALFAAGVVAVQAGAAEARTELVDSLMFAAAYARYAWLSGIAMAAIGVTYALLRRWTVMHTRYVRVGPWEMGLDTLFSAVIGYAAFSVAASAWEPLRVVHAWLFWAWGPVFAWLLARLQEVYVLWMVRPDWSLAVESAVRVLMPRRFGCSASDLRVQVDEETYAVTVYAAMDAAEAVRARELIQAIPETRTVTVEVVESLEAIGRRGMAESGVAAVRGAGQTSAAVESSAAVAPDDVRTAEGDVPAASGEVTAGADDPTARAG